MSIRTEVLMGTTVTIDTVAGEAAAAIERGLAWFRVVEEVCTRFDPGSELSQLTMQPGVATRASDLLFEAVRFALHVAAASGGAFDPTVGARMHRRGFDREHRTGTAVPLPIAPVDDVSYRDVAIDETRRTVTVRRPLLLDLGAVAKGLAIDLAARELSPLGDFAIDAGGDLYLGGLNHDRKPWSVGIRHPRRPGECISSVQVTNRAVCTSGDYERRMPARENPHQSEHHIIDPRRPDRAAGAQRGRLVNPARTVASVTVVAESAMLADALATAAFVLGPDDGVRFLEQMGVEGLIVTDGLEQSRTRSWPGE